jgi:hypothetical protein
MTLRRVAAVAVLIGLVLLWFAKRAPRSRPNRREATAPPANEPTGVRAGSDVHQGAVVFEQTAPAPEDERVERIRARVAAGGTLTEEEQNFMRSEGVDVDPDHDPLAKERGGKLGRGFWDEDRQRDLI